MELLIVTGFLGAGKTTFILRMIGEVAETGARVAMIVNDFGKVNVDGKVMERYGLDVVELSGGCICCTLGASLIETVETLAHNFKPDLIIIEPSGIADPESMKEVLEEYGGHLFNCLRIAVIVDAERFEVLRIAMKKPFANQLSAGDIILLNKIDAVEEGDIAGIMSELREMGFSGEIISISAADGTNTSDAVGSLLSLLRGQGLAS